MKNLLFKNVLILINPQAGAGHAARQLPLIRGELENQGLVHEVFSSTAPGSIRRYLAESDLVGFDAVIAAGGDGTLFEVLNGLMAHTADLRPPLGLIPVGTGNAFSRDLGLIAGDWRVAIEKVRAGKTRQLDIGQLDCSEGRYYFLNIAGMGFVVDAGITASKLKGLGQVSYTLAALWQTLKLSSYPLLLEIDGNAIKQDNLFLEISNSRYTGTSFLMAPGACLEDGLLDLTLLRNLPRLRLLSLFRTIYSGTHIEQPEVTVMQGKRFEIQQPAGYPMMIDGEFVGITPATVCCLPGELTVIV